MEGEELGTSEGAVRISSSLVADHHDGHDTPPPLLSKQPRSNEYVLNVAFGSFLGFTILQFVFALVAHSQAMLADCAAMAVDALTYLFNYAAERLKHQNESKHPTDMDNTSPAILHRRKRLRRLYLELFPPLISVSTLAVVTALSLKEAISNIAGDDDDENDEPDVNIMLLFSALNLVLDAINVSCFASADQAVGLVSFQSTSSQDDHDNEENGRLPNELSSLLKARRNGQYEESSMYDSTAAETNMLDDDASSTDSADSLNLNMCSAWTVSAYAAQIFHTHCIKYDLIVLIILFVTDLAHLCRYLAKRSRSLGSGSRISFPGSGFGY